MFHFKHTYVLLFFFTLFLSSTLPLGWATELYKGPGQSIPLQGNDHIASIKSPHVPYNSNPPTSGPHVGNVARWGIHRTPVPKELQVHNLEDGGVIIQYNCKNCPDLLLKLKKIAKRYNRILLAPYPNMEEKIALTAWGKIDKFSEFNEGRIIRFTEAYIGIDHHPEKNANSNSN